MEVLYHGGNLLWIVSSFRGSGKFSQNFPIFVSNFDNYCSEGNETISWKKKILLHSKIEVICDWICDLYAANANIFCLAGKRCPAAAIRRRKPAAWREVPSWSGSTHGPEAPIQGATRPSPTWSRCTRDRAAPGRVTTPPVTSRISARYRAIVVSNHHQRNV